MIRSTCAVVVIAAVALCAQTAESAPASGFDNGYWIAYERGGGVTVRAAGGGPVVTVSAETPISNAAVDRDGWIAATLNERTRKPGIALFRADGRQERFVETAPFFATAVRFGDDHTVWAVVYRPNPTLEAETDYALLRNYDREGHLKGSYLMRNTLDRQALVAPLSSGFQWLHVGGGRIGIMIDPARVDRAAEWVETDLKGNVTGRWNADGYLVQGLTAGGAVFANDGPGTGVYRLDRAAGKWVRVETGARGRLVGVDGERMVFLER